MKAVIPAAGLGTRFLPATKAMPKEMLPLVDKPAIQFVVEEAVASGIDDILIITGRGKRAIEDHFDRSLELEKVLEKNGKSQLQEIEDIAELADIHYIRQKEAKGLGHAILCAKKHVGDDPFAVLLGDDIVFSKTPCTKQLIELYDRFSSPIIAVEEVQKNMIESYGVVGGKLVEEKTYQIDTLVEKPKPKNAPSNLGVIGRYILTPQLFETLEKTPKGHGGEIQLTDALQLLNKTHKMYAYLFEGVRYDLGNKFDYMRANIEYAIERHEIGPRIKKFLVEYLKK
ncbi:MAG: UTP--glucose-1-phosphate uridylyltransferase GalU [Candidatus Altiarchaeota archaeon]